MKNLKVNLKIEEHLKEYIIEFQTFNFVIKQIVFSVNNYIVLNILLILFNTIANYFKLINFIVHQHINQFYYKLILMWVPNL